MARHRQTSIIWAHTGLGRFVKPTSDHLELLKEILDSGDFAHVSFDLSWDEVAKYVTADDAATTAWANLITAHPDRFLFGSDAVAPRTQEAYLTTYRAYRSLWDRLDPVTAAKVKTGNYERIFDAARQKVRAWEKKEAARSISP